MKILVVPALLQSIKWRSRSVEKYFGRYKSTKVGLIKQQSARTRVHGTGPVKKDNNNNVRLQSDQMRVEDGEGGEVQKVEGR